MRDGETNVYTALATLRNGQMQLQWSRVQMFLVFNTVAIPIVFGSSQTEGVKASLSAIGVVVHFALFVAAIRADRWIKFWDEKIHDLELLDSESEAGIRVTIFSSTDLHELRGERLSSRKIFAPIGITIFVLWFVQLLYHMYIFL